MINHPADMGAATINREAGMEAAEGEAATTNREAGMEVEMTVRAGRVEARAEAWEVVNLADSLVGQEAWSQGLSRRECKLRKELLKRKDGSHQFSTWDSRLQWKSRGLHSFVSSSRLDTSSIHFGQESG
jgi:membrane-bound ClpP family serine protease